MSMDRPARRTLVGVGIVALWVLVVSPRHSPLVLFNRTPSLPTGFYLRWGGDWPRRGDVVAFALPPAAWSYARLRGERTDVLLLKHVLAGGGDFVSTLHGELFVNGVRVGSIASLDSAGRALPHWSAARVLASDELLVGSSHPRSFDSRYFGPIHADQVLGVYRRLSLGFPSAAPIASGSLRNALASSPPRRSHVIRPADHWMANIQGVRGRRMNQVGQGKGRLLTLRVTAASIWSWV